MKKYQKIFTILVFSFTGLKTWANPPEGKETEEHPAIKAIPSLACDEKGNKLNMEKPDQENTFGFAKEPNEELEIEIEQSSMFCLDPDFGEYANDERFEKKEERFAEKEEEKDRFQDMNSEKGNLPENTPLFQKKKE